MDEAAESGSLNDAIVEFLEETVANDSDDFFDKAVETIVVNESTQGNLEDLPQPVFMEIKNISDGISVSKLCTQSFTIIFNFWFDNTSDYNKIFIFFSDGEEIFPCPSEDCWKLNRGGNCVLIDDESTCPYSVTCDSGFMNIKVCLSQK